jgi:hypothetical protein
LESDVPSRGVGFAIYFLTDREAPVRRGFAEHLVQLVYLALVTLWIPLPAIAKMEDTLMNNEVSENT